MNRDELLNELLYLRQARILEYFAADIMTDRERFSKDLETHRFNPAVRRYLKKKIAKADYAIWDYKERIKTALSKCEYVQRELPVELVLDLHYINCAIDDLLTRRVYAHPEQGLTAAFKLRRDARHEEINRRIENKLDLAGMQSI